MDVPFNRDEILSRLRQGRRRNPDSTGRIIRTSQGTGWLENLTGSLQRSIVAVSDLGILVYQLIKYAFIAVFILLGLVLAYHGFRYVLLFLICVQNQL